MSSRYSLVNDQLVPVEEASLLITDLAIQRGYGIFDFLKALKSKPVFLEDHLDRLYNSLAALNLPFAYDREKLKSLLYGLIQKNNIENSGIRITVTGGYSPDGFSIAEKSNMIVTQQPLTLNNPVDGIKLITLDHQRQLPHVKSLDYMMAIWMKPRIAEKSAQDVLYCPGGIIAECPRANFYLVTDDDRILTPKDNILKGVIRKQLLKFSDKFFIEETAITVADIARAKEAFITSTTKNILPVIQIDDKVIGNGKPGAITSELNTVLETFISEHLELSILHHA